MLISSFTKKAIKNQGKLHTYHPGCLHWFVPAVTKTSSSSEVYIEVYITAHQEATSQEKVQERPTDFVRSQQEFSGANPLLQISGQIFTGRARQTR